MPKKLKCVLAQVSKHLEEEVGTGAKTPKQPSSTNLVGPTHIENACGFALATERIPGSK